MHYLTNQVLEIAGDGVTAKGVWFSPGILSTVIDGKPQASWAYRKYGVDFVKEDGVWKFWHLHVYNVFTTPFEKNWTETKENNTTATGEYGPDRGPTYSWRYSPELFTEPVPKPPQPYYTFNPETSYVK